MPTTEKYYSLHTKTVIFSYVEMRTVINVAIFTQLRLSLHSYAYLDTATPIFTQLRLSLRLVANFVHS